MSVSVSMTGLRDLEKQIERLRPATGKGALRSSLRSVAEPLAADMRQRAPADPNGQQSLKTSIGVGTRLEKRQAGLHRKMFRDDKASVEIFVGPSYSLGGGGRHGHLQEFGTRHHPAQPFARPAWDAARGSLLDRLSAAMWANVERSISRADRRGTLIG